MAHPDSINYIALCLRSVDAAPAETDDYRAKKFRTHVLVLELLAAVCLVPSGHTRVMSAFDNFKEVLCVCLLRIG